MLRATMLGAVVSFAATALADLSDPYFPRFHVRPAYGHVNDPNGPFYDPVHGKYHLFMQAKQYRPDPATPGIEWAHFASEDLALWVAGLGVGIQSDGVGCPNSNGCYSGSAVVVDGVPTIVYPGVHAVPKSPTHPDGVGMAQCLARPANLSDPWLRRWNSSVIVPTDPVPGDVNNHFHDDAEPWRSASDGRWYTFASGGSADRKRGVNLLYSTTDEAFRSPGGGGLWREEHALWNITTGQCNFVSCPEMYPLPGAPGGTPRTSGTVVYESLCGCDQYWLGHYDDGAHAFQPFASYVPPLAAPHSFCYDYGAGRASKSFWDTRTASRVMWSWITGGKHAPNATWDCSQTVPRVVTMAPPPAGKGRGQELAVNPAPAVDALRENGPPVVSLPPADVPAGSAQPVHDAGGVQLDVAVNLSWPKGADDVLAGVSVLVPVAAGNNTTGASAGDTNSAGCIVTFSASRSSFDFLPGTNIPHGDLRGADFSLNNSRPWTLREGAAACAAGCDALPACSCWTYVPSGQGAPRCAIKGPGGAGGGPLFPEPGADVSGYKAGRVPRNFTVPNGTVVSVSACDGSTMPGHVAVGGGGGGLSAARLRVLVDRSVVEVYDGVSALSTHVFPPGIERLTGVQLTAQTPGVRASLVVHRMRAAVVPAADID